MKTMTHLLFLCVAMCALIVSATGQTTWKLSRDVLLTANEISFNQGSAGVWYFMQSSTSTHDPKTYKFLADYSAPCKTNGTEALIPGVDCWRNPNLDAQRPPGGCQLYLPCPVPRLGERRSLWNSSAIGLDASGLLR